MKFSSVHSNAKEDRRWDLGCKAIPGLTFSSDKWISITPGNGWDAPQEWYGVASDSFLVGFRSHHDSRKEDRIYRFFTARSDIITLQDCTGWKKLNDYDRPIDLQLGDDEVIAGVKSVHNSRKEDRQFSVITCKIITAYEYFVDCADCDIPWQYPIDDNSYDCEEDGINYVGRQPVTSSEQVT